MRSWSSLVPTCSMTELEKTKIELKMLEHAHISSVTFNVVEATNWWLFLELEVEHCNFRSRWQCVAIRSPKFWGTTNVYNFVSSPF